VPTVSRDQLHRVVEELPEDRLGAAAEFLEALARHDDRVAKWRASLKAADVSQIASSLRQKYAEGDWVSDDDIEAWMNSNGGGDEGAETRVHTDA